MSKANTSAINNLQSFAASRDGEFLPFCRPAIEQSDIDEVVKVLQSGWITSGAKVKELESMIVEMTGCRHAIAVSSATAGMQLILHAMDVGPGDEVITPSMTWVSTVNLIRLCGAIPVFVDVDRDTLMTTADHIEQAITMRTKLFIPVHYAGAPLDLGSLQRIAGKYSIPMIEDAAHALGTDYEQVPVGRKGTAIFSLQAIKNVTTAEGGIICTDNDALAERLRRLRFHGLGSDAFDRDTNSRLPNAEVIEPGYKCNLPDMNACLALGQLGRLRARNEKRGRYVQRYMEAFASNDAITPLAVPAYEHTHAWHLFMVRVETDRVAIDRDEFMDALKELGIGTGLHFRAVHQHRYYKTSILDCDNRLENTNWNSDRLVTLPLFPNMGEANVERVIDAVNSVTARYAK